MKISEGLREVRERIARAARRSGRDPDSVRLIAVSKTHPAERIAEALDAGIERLGENRVQEAEAKRPQVARLRPDAGVEWHLIGPLQRNKARRAVALFDVVESVDRPALVDALARAAAEIGVRRRVLLQANLDREAQKAGARPEDLPALLDCVRTHPELEAVGLMAIPRQTPDPREQRAAFSRLRELRDGLRDPAICELSMGMSADFEVAIEEGATWVRVGTAIFGARADAGRGDRR